MKRGRGVACGIYEAMSYAAVVADVEVHAATGQARLPKLWCARDCGHVINPNQVRAQCEGNLVLVHVIALMEQLPVAASSVTTTAFAHLRICRFQARPACRRWGLCWWTARSRSPTLGKLPSWPRRSHRAYRQLDDRRQARCEKSLHEPINRIRPR